MGYNDPRVLKSDSSASGVNNHLLFQTFDTYHLFGNAWHMASPTVLIVVVNRPQDLETILTKKWYRIPVKRMPLRHFDYIAFYQTTAFGKHGGQIKYFGRVTTRKKTTRAKLLPNETHHPRAHHEYYQFSFRTIRKLSRPIVNKPGMRINFGYATLNKLNRARTLASLYGIRQVEAVFHKLLAKNRIPFSAELPIRKNGKIRYRLDFAIFCRKGNINVECDMRKFHRGIRCRKDTKRDCFMKKNGWKVRRYTDQEILSDPAQCLKDLKICITSLGGISRS